MRKLFLLLLVCFSTQSLAWWDTPHMLVAQIAYDNLTPEVRKRADDLIAIHAKQYPKANDFVSAAMWADDIRAQGDKSYSSWHYVTLTFKDVNEPMPARDSFPDKYHVAWAVNEEMAILQNPTASESDKGLALRRLIHWVGDIHQPLHAASHVSPNYPKGDSGGNLFLTALPKPSNNLHSYWDSGLSHWFSTDRPLTPDSKTQLKTESRRLVELYGHQHLKNMDPYEWALDSHYLARTYAYTGIEYKGLPSPDYIAQGERLTDKQVTLAGERLGAVLNNILSH